MAQLDHVVLLLPHQDILNPPSWITDHFINRLVLFPDGTYLELIAFVDDDPARRRGHWWDREYGVIDFALTSNSPAMDQFALNQRLSRTETDIAYDTPQEGGRLKPDGQELKWRVTFPKGVVRGGVPFWCQDVTPRERRVPKANVNQPCGAIGMSAVRIESGCTQRLCRATEAILEAGTSDGNGVYEMDVPIRFPNSRKPRITIVSRTSDRNDESGVPSLSLILQGPKEVPAISHKIGQNGLVSIEFETNPDLV